MCVQGKLKKPNSQLPWLCCSAALSLPWSQPPWCPYGVRQLTRTAAKPPPRRSLAPSSRMGQRLGEQKQEDSWVERKMPHPLITEGPESRRPAAPPARLARLPSTHISGNDRAGGNEIQIAPGVMCCCLTRSIDIIKPCISHGSGILLLSSVPAR